MTKKNGTKRSKTPETGKRSARPDVRVDGGKRRGKGRAGRAVAGTTTGRVYGTTAPRAARQAAITDPAQRVLAEAVPRICEIWGFDPANLTTRGKSTDPAEYVRNSYREQALGAVTWLGRELGIAWTGLHGYAKEGGRTEVPALRGANRYSLCLFASRFGASTGLGDDPDAGREVEPIGTVGRHVRREYELIRADAARALASLVAPAGEMSAA